MKTRLIAFLFAVAFTLPMQSCVENPPGSDWQRPPRYGHGGTDGSRKKKPPSENRKPQNRFGYSGEEPDGPPSTSGPSASRDRDVEPLTTTDGDEKPAVEKPSGKPNPSDMPFAKGVPGNPLAVKVPGRESLGEISIEQYDASNKATGKPLPPGTPVSIPDPQNPGKEIYFKVP